MHIRSQIPGSRSFPNIHKTPIIFLLHNTCPSGVISAPTYTRHKKKKKKQQRDRDVDDAREYPVAFSQRSASRAACLTARRPRNRCTVLYQASRLLSNSCARNRTVRVEYLMIAIE